MDAIILSLYPVKCKWKHGRRVLRDKVSFFKKGWTKDASFAIMINADPPM